MLRTASSLRLTPDAVKRFTILTSIEPVGIYNDADLDAYVQRCKQRFWGTSPETRCLHRLIDMEAARYRYPA